MATCVLGGGMSPFERKEAASDVSRSAVVFPMRSRRSQVTIPAFPTLRVSSLLGAGGPSIQRKLLEFYPDADIQLFYLGRSAIWNGIKLLGLGPRDTILMPSYHCSVEVEAVLQAGVGVRFFEVDADMNANLEDLSAKVDNTTKAVFVIHYFGFPQRMDEIREICDERSLLLIEDCAHALFGRAYGKPLGTHGDLGILSMQKFLPLPDGGVLLANRSDLRRRMDVQSPNRRSVVRVVIFRILKNIQVEHPYLHVFVNAGLISPARRILRFLRGSSDLSIINPTSVDFDPRMANLGMSAISKRISRRVGLRDIVSRRRGNYELLVDMLKHLDSVEIPFSDLPDGVCPYFLPVAVRDRDHVRGRLLERNVEAFVFGESLHGALPGEGFENARYLSRHILALPVHQDLDREQLELVAGGLRDVLRV